MVVEKRKEFKEFEECKGVQGVRGEGAGRRQPWSVPRLRGRGEQGDMVTPAPGIVYALYRVD
jgi:hypothetical protein